MSGLVDLNIKPGYWGDNHNSHPSDQSLHYTSLRASHEKDQKGQKWLEFSHYELRVETVWGSEENLWPGAADHRPYHDINPISSQTQKHAIHISRWIKTAQTQDSGLVAGVVRILLLKLVALSGTSPLFVSGIKLLNRLDLRIKLWAAAAIYSVQIPLTITRNLFKLTNPAWLQVFQSQSMG